MDYYANSKSEEATIYEIYKSCRLCGAGAGYKMPIIQNVINLDPDETELKQKIRECVQIEVHQDDKMPPLICELCVDKVNDFYEFLEMCKQTNKKTRLRLGLPPQTLPRGAPDAGDCILGLTEPVFINESSNETPSTRSAKAVKTKKEMEPKVNPKFRKKEDTKTPKLSELRNDVKITRSAESKKDSVKVAKSSESQKDVKITRSAESKNDLEISKALAESSNLRSGRSRQPSPPRSLRGTKRPSEDNTPVSKVQKTNKPEATPPKSILKKIKQEVPDELLEPRNKRPRDSTRETIETPKKEVNKKAKVTVNIPKIKVEPKPAAPSPPPTHKCTKCKNTFKTSQALSSHMNSHIQVKVEKVETPKPEPKPKTQRCSKCDKTFPATAFKDHKCKQPECKFCKRKFLAVGACTNHEKFCSVGSSAKTTPSAKTTLAKPASSTKTPAKTTPAKTTPAKTTPTKTTPAKTTPPARTISSAKTSSFKKLKIPQWLKSQLLPMEVRLMRCDPLCDDNGHCRDACFVDHDYGLDKTREYPYLYNLSMLTHKLRIKSELAMYDRMVKIQDNIRDEFDLDEFYTHWDSASDSDSDIEMFKPKSKSAVKKLSTLSLKVLFSPKGLGKVPKKLRKIKPEKPFDSILNSTDLDSDKFGISNIINSLDDSINDNDNTKDFLNEKFKTKHDDTLFGENKGPGVKNSDFDLLFGSTSNKDNLSSSENVERGSPSLDISSVDNRLSRADENKESNVEDKNNSVSSTENTDASIENESHNKSESDIIDRMSSSHTSVIASPSKNKTQDEDKENHDESKENMIENGEYKSLTLNGEKLNSSTVSTALEHSVREKSNELIADKDDEHDKANNANDAVNSNNGSEVVNCSVNGDKDKLNVDDIGAASDTDMDDGKLMEAIDAQLGESDIKRAIVTDNLSSKESDDFTKDIEF